MKIFLLKKIWIVSITMLYAVFVQCFLSSMLLARGSAAQSVHKVYLSVDWQDANMGQVLSTLEGETGFRFLFNGNKIRKIRGITMSAKNKSLASILQTLAEKKGLYFKRVNQTISVKMKEKSQSVTAVAFEEQYNTTISGQVSDSEGNVLPGANVVLKNTVIGTITDIDGNYKLEIPDDSETLVVSFIGYDVQEVAIGGRSEIDVVLNVNSTTLGEVVVTALGVVREKRSLGYSVTEIEGNSLTQARDVNVINTLSGKVAGVDIAANTTGPGGSTRVVIRGNTQLTGSNQPLYVVDGIPIDNTTLGRADQWGGVDQGDGISSLNPDDIDNISVLKGPAAAALYGNRASNGAILITTKKGTEGQGIGVEYNSNVTFESVLTKFDEYQKIYGQGRTHTIPRNLQQSRGSSSSSWGDKLNVDSTITIFDSSEKPYSLVNDNIKGFFRIGSTVTNTVSLTGGTKKSTFRASVSDLRNKDIVPQSDLRRNTFSIRGSLKPSDKLTIDSKVNYIYEEVNNRRALSSSASNIGVSLIGLAPNLDQEWLKKSEDSLGNYLDWNNNNFRLNPYWVLNRMKNESKKDRVIGFISTKYNFTDWLSLQLRVGTDFYKYRYSNGVARSTPTLGNGQLTEIIYNHKEINADWLLSFNKEINQKISLSTNLGGNTFDVEDERFDVIGTGEIAEGVKSITNYEEQTISFSNPKKVVNSLYGFIQASYDNILYLEITGRNDWSSTLPLANNSFFYPSISTSFVFSEAFKLGGKIFSFGKVRASWAEVGGGTDPYNLNLTYGLKKYSFQGNALGFVNQQQVPNRELKPSSTRSIEIGADLRFFNDRLNLDVTYYRTSTVDQILNLPVSETSGYQRAVVNAGEIENKGIEIQLQAQPVRTRDFSWDMTLIFSKNQNKIIKLGDDLDRFVISEARWAGAIIAAEEGGAYGSIMGRTYQRDPNGNIVHGTNGLPIFSDTLATFGNGVYEWASGITQTITYKGFSLSALFDMKFGADIFSMTNQTAYVNGSHINTLPGRDQWRASEAARMSASVSAENWSATGGYLSKGVVETGTNDAGEKTYAPNEVFVNPVTYWALFQDNTPEPFVYDASFIKLRQLTLSYSLPAKLIQKTPFASVSVSAVGRNLFILYDNVPNIDPESNYNNGNGQGFEYGSLPTQRSYGFNVNVKF